MDEPRIFGPLLIVIALAFLVPLVLTRVKHLRLPVVVGEILVGILVGRSFLNWVPYSDPVLDLLADIGFVFLMFLAGMEIDFSALGLSPRGPRTETKQYSPIFIGVFNFGATLVLAGLISYWLWYTGMVRNVWLVALILSTTSLGVVVPVLKEHGLIGSVYGQTLLVTALIADFVTMLLITIDVTIISSGLTFEILLVGLLFVAMFLIYHFGRIIFARIPSLPRLLDELSSATTQIKVRASMTIMLAFVVLSEILGTEVILGAFLAGVIISLLRRPEDASIVHQLETIGYGFFIPIFFIMIGVGFNLDVLLLTPQALLLVPLILISAVVVKFLPALFYRLRFNWPETLGAGAILSARLSLIIAAAEIGLELGVITEAMDMAIILVAMITVTLAPVIFVRLVPAPADRKARPIVVVGAGELGLQVATELRAHHEKVLIIDNVIDRINRARQQGFTAQVSELAIMDGSTNGLLEGARALVCTHADTQTSLRICRNARTQVGLERVITLVTEPAAAPQFEQEGILPVVVGRDRVRMLTMLARSGSVYELLTRTDDDKEVWELIVKNPGIVGKALRELSMPGDVLILTIRRDGEVLLPHGNTQLAYGDQLSLVGSEAFSDEVQQVFG